MFSSNASQVSDSATYIEDVFSTYLYAGTNTAQTITNGIDLAGKGGMVWTKDRANVSNHFLYTGASGAYNIRLSSNVTSSSTDLGGVNSFLSSGYSLLDTGGNANGFANGSNRSFASWTFRKQPKFFDVVTYTGTGTQQAISHNLGSVPGCIIVKQTAGTSAGLRSWYVYHRSLGATKTIFLNLTNASQTDSPWGNTEPTSTHFTVNGDNNVNGGTYVAYLFAHDAGGFGLSGEDNVISCGSYTTDASGNGTLQNIGFEPQFLIIKKTNGTEDWVLADVIRGVRLGASYALFPNATTVETLTGIGFNPNATGFTPYGSSSATYIYIAIRRGPMKVPESGTSVFGLNARTGTGAIATVTGSAGVSDAVLIKNRGAAVASLFSSRLTGTGYLVTSTTAAEVAAGATILQANPWDVMDGVKVGTTSTITNASANTYINYLFDRAPGFFDVVCYTGNSSNQTIAHNLGTAPLLIIAKKRSGTGQWPVYAQPIGATNYLQLNTSSAQTSGVLWNNTTPTASVFSVGADGDVNLSGATYVAYLFATLLGVSKVGSYTGTGATLQVDCGFTAGARFVMIKRTDSTGDWYVWDTARGMIPANDPYLILNLTNAEVTSNDYVDTYSAGFEISSTAPAAINASGGSFIFLAIA